MIARFYRLPVVLALLLALGACDNPSPAEKVSGFLASAAENRAAGKLDAAVIELKNALQAAPKNAEARRRLGETYLAQRNWDSAAKELRRARDYGADSPALRANLAEALLGSGAAKDVLDLIAAPGADADLDAPMARRLQGLRARALLASGEPDAATALAERVLAAGDSLPAQLVLAEAAADAGAHARAVVAADRALALAPDNLDALLLKAESLRATGQARRALETFQAARKAPRRPLLVDLGVIQSALDNGERALAWQVLDELSAAHERDPRVQYFQALRYLAEGDLTNARKLAEGAAGRAPNFIPAVYVAGAVNLELGNHEIARAYLKRVAGASPSNMQVRGLLAEAKRRLDRSVMTAGDAAAASATADEGPSEAGGAKAGDVQVAKAIPSGESEDFAPDVESPEGRQAAVEQILQNLRAGRLDAALDQAEDLESELPDSVLPLQLQSAALWRQGKRDEAIARMERAHERAPNDAPTILNLAQFYRAEGRLDDARALLDPALERFPKHAGLHIEAARLEQAGPSPDTARIGRLLRAALDAEPRNVDARTFLARLHLIEDAPEKALSVVQAAPGEQRDTPSLLEIEGRAYLQQGDGDAAVEAFRALVATAPERAQAHNLLGNALLAQDKPGEAVEVLKEAQALADGDPGVAQALAEAHRLNGDPKAALAVAEAALAAHPANAALHIAAARAEGAQQNAEAVRGHLEAALKHAPDNATARLYLARVHLSAGEAQKSLEVLDNAPESVASLPGLLEVKGRAQRALGRSDAARATFEALIQAAPNQPDGYIRLGEVQLAAGRPDAAMAALKRGREQVAGPAGRRITELMAELALQQGDYDQAAGLYRELVAAAPDNAAYQNNLAWTLGEQGRFAPALTHARKAVELAPNSPDVRDTLGVVLMKSGQTEAAVAELAQAHEAAGGRPDIALHHAEALIAAGRAEAASEILAGLAGQDMPAGLKADLDRLQAQVAKGK